MDFPGGTDDKESACNAENPSLIPGLRRSLEKGMATHSSILAWKIPWIEEPGELQFMGSQRVRKEAGSCDLLGFPGGVSGKEPFGQGR